MRKPLVLLFSLFLLALVPVHAETDSPVVVKWLTTRNQIAVIHAHTVHFYTPELQPVESFALIEESDPDVFIRDALWSADEKRLAVLVDFTTRKELQLWDMEQRQRLTVIDRHPSGYMGDMNFRAFTWSPDGQFIAISTLRLADSQEMVRFFDAGTGIWTRDILLDGYDPSFMEWHYPNEILLSRYYLEAWSLDQETSILTQTVGISAGYPAHYNTTGNRIAFRSSADNGQGQLIEIRDANSFEQLQTLTHDGWVVNFQWSTSKLVSIDSEGTTYIWNTDTGNLIARFETGRLSWVELSPDGRRILTLNSNGEVIIRDSITGEILARLCRECINAPATPHP